MQKYIFLSSRTHNFVALSKPLNNKIAIFCFIIIISIFQFQIHVCNPPYLYPLQLVEKNKLKPQRVHQFLKYSNDAKYLVQTYFNLSTPLYFDYTHLVCRTAKNVKCV